MSELDDLCNERADLERRIRVLDTRIHALKLDKARQEYGVFVGCLVESQGKIYRVTEVDVRFAGKPSLSGYPQKKDGSYSKHEYSIWREWRIV